MFTKLHSGELYDPGEADITALQRECLERLWDYNATRPSEGERREALLREISSRPSAPTGADASSGSGRTCTQTSA